MENRVADKRRKLIQGMASSGKSMGEIGREFHISRERVSQLLKRAKDLDEREELGMGLKLYRRVSAALMMESPTLIDVRRFVTENPDWRERLLRVHEVGPKTLTEFESYCRKQGFIK